MALPNTYALMAEVQTLITAANLYKTVVIGSAKDWTELVPVCEIVISGDNSEHFAHGGQIRDTQSIRVTTGVDYISQTPVVALQQLCTIRDTIIPMFQQHSILAGVNGVQDSRVKPGSPKISYLISGGKYYLIHEFEIEVRSTYNVPIGAQGV